MANWGITFGCSWRPACGTAPAAQAPDHRRLQPVDHRAPDELDRIGEADPGQGADGGQLDAVVRQPEAEGVADQHERSHKIYQFLLLRSSIFHR